MSLAAITADKPQRFIPNARGLWTQIQSTNPIERHNREVSQP